MRALFDFLRVLCFLFCSGVLGRSLREGGTLEMGWCRCRGWGVGRVGGQEGQAVALVTAVPRVYWSCVVVCVSVCVSWLGILIDVCALALAWGPISEDNAGRREGGPRCSQANHRQPCQSPAYEACGSSLSCWWGYLGGGVSVRRECM